MDENLKRKTQKTAELYFKGVTDERPYDLWRAFDKDLANQFSVFITGRLYARERIPHTTRQLITIATLTVLSRLDELRLHIHAALNVGCRPQEILRVTARHVDLAGQRWVFRKSESNMKRFTRVVYLPDKALGITRRLMLKHPRGPLFRNSKGRAWTVSAVRHATRSSCLAGQSARPSHRRVAFLGQRAGRATERSWACRPGRRQHRQTV